MRRSEFKEALRRAAEITGDRDIVVLGSQSVHGAFSEAVLPAPTMDSMELDCLAINDADGEKSWDLLGRAGDGSGFHQIYHIHLDGVDIGTSALPDGWTERLIPFPVEEGPDAVVGWCLEPHDLVMAKTIAGRDKDYAFVKAMVDACLVDPREAERRMRALDGGCFVPTRQALDRARAYLSRLQSPPHLFQPSERRPPRGRRRPTRDEFPEVADMWADLRGKRPTEQHSIAEAAVPGQPGEVRSARTAARPAPEAAASRTLFGQPKAVSDPR